MAQIKNINHNPRLLRYLVDLRFFGQDKLRVVDVGVRGGFEMQWELYEDQVELIGIEADEKEAERLNRREKSSKKSYYPETLFKKNGEVNLFVTSYVPSSGLYEPDLKFLSRIPDEKNLTVTKVQRVKTTTLDIFLKKIQAQPVDFVKLDVEGAELDVLKGALSTLKSTIGVACEVWFYPVHKNQPLFSDVDQFLRKRGLVLYELEVARHARKVLSDQIFEKVPGATTKGQVIWGQALYLRDAVFEFEKERGVRSWNEMRILKLATILDLANLADCAIELIQEADKKGLLKNFSKNQLVKLLIPEIGGKNVSILVYLKHLRLTKRHGVKISKLIWFVKKIGTKLLPFYLKNQIRKAIVAIRNQIDIILES